jgi:hypothetical protein
VGRAACRLKWMRNRRRRDLSILENTSFPLACGPRKPLLQKNSCHTTYSTAKHVRHATLVNLGQRHVIHAATLTSASSHTRAHPFTQKTEVVTIKPQGQAQSNKTELKEFVASRPSVLQLSRVLGCVGGVDAFKVPLRCPSECLTQGPNTPSVMQTQHRSSHGSMHICTSARSSCSSCMSLLAPIVKTIASKRVTHRVTQTARAASGCDNRSSICCNNCGTPGRLAGSACKQHTTKSCRAAG